MSNIYKTWGQLMLNVFLYDKIKDFFMPYDPRKYSGLDLYLKTASAATVCTAATLFLTYPLDLIHTRMVTDMTKKGQPRLFTTSFDCFNRTNLDEGRYGLYKGWQVALINSACRGALTLPLYELT